MILLLGQIKQKYKIRVYFKPVLGDLKNPAKNIPLGTIMAIIVTFILYIIFMCLFSATTTRDLLISDQMIGAEISGSSWLFNIGIYLSSISGCSAATYG